MPKINDYSAPELNAVPGKIDSNSDLKYGNDLNQAVSNFGQSIQDVSGTIYKRQAQTEVSDIAAKFSQARAEWSQTIDDGVRDGSIDSQKVKDGFQDYVNNMQGEINTREGRDFFNRQAARLGQSVFKGAARGQAVVAGAKAEANARSTLDNNSSAVQSDPSSFEDVYSSSIEGIDAQVQTGAFPAALAEKFKHETGVELAKNAMRGWAQIDPPLAEKKLKDGEFNQYFNGDVKAQMQGYINAQKSAKEVEERRQVAAQEKAQKAAGEAWEQKALPDLAKGALHTQAILNSPMDAEHKIRWLKLADEATKENTQGDPRVFNDLVRRTQLPDDDPQKISDISQLAPFAGRGVSIQQVEQIGGFMGKLPEGQYIHDNRKRLLDFATAKLIKKDSFMGLSDPDGEYNMSQFQIALQQAETQMRKENKPVGTLYNTDSPDYFGKQISKYQQTPQEIFAKMAGKTRDETTGPQTVAAPEGGAKNKDQKVRQQGESAADYLKRIGKGNE